jgi:dihydrofolate synthase / folylpolyglutamate synthase
MNYHDSISYLQNLTKFGFNFGLGRIEELMKRVGEPHKKLKVIHVGGTNGKGSTSILTSYILQTAGYKVGVFTSPHLHAYTERYRINGMEISQKRIAQLITEIKPILEAMVTEGFEHPTEFEVSTALAFIYFAQEKVDFLVLEVGLGGAIDSTNVVNPLISVITNVAMDHMDYLGESIEEIATVKAGIIKDNGVVVTATENPKVLAVIEDMAREKGGKVFKIGKDTTYEILSSTMLKQQFNLNVLGQKYQQLTIHLLGKHQVTNAATAVTIIELLETLGYSIGEEAIRQGLEQAKWAGRLEIIQANPMVLLDGAHNLDGAISLSIALKEIFQYENLIMVFGMLGDKEREKVIAQLAPLANQVIVTKPNSPRAGEWQQMGQEAAKYVRQVYIKEEISQAVKLALDLAGEKDLVCITGSLYMVAEAREYFLRHEF